MTQTPRWRAALAALFLLLITPFLRGQSTNGSISGRVVDPTNARIPQAGVVAVAAATNARYETTSDASGEYHLTSVPPGRYRLEVEKSGFKKAVRPDVVVHVQDALEINFELPWARHQRALR